MNLKLLAAAEVELEDAHAWYAARSVPIAKAFLAEVRTAMVLIAERPHA